MCPLHPLPPKGVYGQSQGSSWTGFFGADAFWFRPQWPKSCATRWGGGRLLTPRPNGQLGQRKTGGVACRKRELLPVLSRWGLSSSGCRTAGNTTASAGAQVDAGGQHLPFPGSVGQPILDGQCGPGLPSWVGRRNRRNRRRNRRLPNRRRGSRASRLVTSFIANRESERLR